MRRWSNSHSAVRRTFLGLGMVVVGLVGIYIGMLVAGDTEADIGPFAARLSVTPSLSGGTDVEIPPLGSLGLDSHDGPAHLTVRLDALDQNRTFALASDANGLEAASEQAVDDLKHGVLVLVERTIVAGLLSTVLVSAVVFRSWRKVLICGGVSAVIMAAAGVVAVGTFRPRSIEEPTYEGLLSNAPAVIGDAQHIADQFTKYRDQLQRMVSNVSNVSKLYATFSSLPVYQASPSTIRVLHVSDLHLNPAAWNVIAAVVNQYDIGVVIDTGDINDWGTSLESSFVGPIGSLGVPYVYVRGNHDSVLTAAAVAAQPHASVLEDKVITVDGLTIAGIGDPRFTPDKQADNDAPGQLTAAGTQLAATIAAAGRPVDIALIHDPAAAGPLDGTVPLVLAGHRHAREVSMMPPIAGKPSTRLMIGGSTGGAGLRGLEGDTPTPLEMTVLYLGQDHALQAYDEITVGGTGKAQVTVERRLADENRLGTADTPSSASPDGSATAPPSGSPPTR